MSTFRWAAEEARRFSGELQRLDTDPAADRPDRPGPAGAARAGAGHRAVQLPAQPGRAQGRARPSPSARRSSSSRRPATPADRAAARRDCWPRPTCPPACSRCCRCPTTAPPNWSPTPGCRWCRSPAPGRSARPSAAPVPDKHVTLELGGNAAAVLCADWTADEDLDFAAQRIATFANYQAGQSLHRRAAGVRARRAARRLPAPAGRGGAGAADRRPASTSRPTSGRWSSEDAARRVETWVAEAVAAGGHRRGGRPPRRRRPTRRPCSPACRRTPRSCAEEVFGPVLVVTPVADDAGRVRRGQRLGVRPAGRRLHPPPATWPSPPPARWRSAG